MGGHVGHMQETKPAWKTMTWNLGRQRKERGGKPKLRWINGAENDLRRLGIRNWIILA